MILTSEKIKDNNYSNYIIILKWACFFIFAGRAWQHLFWDAPFRALLWDQELMQGLIQRITGLSWEEYSSSTKVENIIQFFIRTTGWLYVVCAVASISLNKRNKTLGKILLIGAVSLFFLAILNCKEKFFQLGELMEHTIQVISPILLYRLLFKKINLTKLILVSKIAIACTFIGHGLYAVNYYPQPGPYADMVINVFHFEEESAKTILVALGVLDFIFSILIFVPVLSSFALLYCAIWGLLTALARLVAGFDSNFVLATLNQYTFETIYRLSNFMIPVWIFYINEKGISKYISKLFYRKQNVTLLRTEKKG